MQMARRLGRILIVVGVLGLAASNAHAFSMGDTMAATGVQGTLAAGGASSVAGTIQGVKSALGKAVATKEGQLNSAAGWGGKGGGATAWKAGGASAWKAAAANGGWSSNSGGKGGWATAAAGKAWSSGGWGAHAVN
jgi:hypothetical protein